MTKPTFRPRGRPDNSTSCFNKKKNAKAYGETNAQRGQLSENNCQSFNSNSKITSFLGFFRKKCFKTALMCNFCPG